MAKWLFKEEPDHYSFADLRRDGRTTWAGVRNSLARQHLRKVRAGDRILFYHTGKDKAIIGEMRAASNARAMPTRDDPGAVEVDVEPVRQLLHPLPLARIKADPLLVDWELVRLPRLSVMPVTEAQWKRVATLAQESGASPPGAGSRSKEPDEKQHRKRND
jgi:predicted RNA-binding protein with PUA-like domain